MEIIGSLIAISLLTFFYFKYPKVTVKSRVLIKELDHFKSMNGEKMNATKIIFLLDDSNKKVTLRVLSQKKFEEINQGDIGILTYRGLFLIEFKKINDKLMTLLRLDMSKEKRIYHFGVGLKMQLMK
ncbi:DUF2500 domain-containing protein [Chengkuizengella marina]|uniref:DUF2500 family protein n=1 Tax=Chengkuizengella marina TaxID=2507566 RepID=A0A6N9Q269_9BACL|nr:DUF2500 domain-containing protein [Chengkuizengella marina]NBI28650.1 DUF2500 family protein [Chengkuizengella marina]